MALNRRGSVVRRDGRTGTAAERSMMAHDHDGPRRTTPADVGCPTVEEFHRIYNEGRQYPMGKTVETHEHQPPQFKEDQHDNGRGRYHNDTSGWVRSKGEDSTRDRPGGFDHGHFDNNSKPPRLAGGLKASGQDATKSPFSAAHFKDEMKRS
jgi:hypothetical protein